MKKIVTIFGLMVFSSTVFADIERAGGKGVSCTAGEVLCLYKSGRQKLITCSATIARSDRHLRSECVYYNQGLNKIVSCSIYDENGNTFSTTYDSCERHQ